MIKETISSNFRKDGVNIIIRMAEAYINRETLVIVPELPDGAVASEWTTYTGVAVRKDQTGEIYSIAHDVEGSEYTYTEVYLTPDSYSYLQIANGGSGYYTNIHTSVYPKFINGRTYAKGDIVCVESINGGMTYISDIDDNTNDPATQYGWTLYMPGIEYREPHYVTYEELIGGGGV